tara:strand:+ start:32 stop:709 length:678 start_codon:yes stop_codon:yes gene_type:complete
MVNVTIWNEYRSERENMDAATLYPNGIHRFIGEFVKEDGHNIQFSTLDEPENGLPASLLDQTDVLLWWSHNKNEEVLDSVAKRVEQRVLDGMGLIVLHSGLRSKPFHLLMGTTCHSTRRNKDELERVWIISPNHQIVKNIKSKYIEIPKSQIFTEPFDIPQPDHLILISWNQAGDVFRSGCCWNKGNGKIFFLGPGHETHPVYYNKDIQSIIKNSIHWAKPQPNS